MSKFPKRLLAWYHVHGRKDLPWQRTPEPYPVWVSEIMLQQTQVQTVIPYFERFMTSFPSISALADAPRDDVLHHWSGLGYYARARNLHRASIAIRDDHNGQFPDDIDTLLTLPGIGRSTAGAILSLAFGQRQPILDGNVKRVIARHRAIDGWPGKTAVASQLWEIADEYTPPQQSAAYTQAIMDLGATVCTRSKPQCGRCPVRADCQALIGGNVTAYPGRKPKKTRPLRTTTMLLASYDGQVFLERRPEAGIWGGLWSLPEIGTRSVDEWCSDTLNSAAARIETWQPLRHSFSHFDLDIQPIVVRVDAPLSKVADGDDATWYRLDDAPPGGLAAPVKKLIEQLRSNN
ncbi:MAG: A/G-specific adenine glycosylase [Woeseiaceae bacterium]